MGTRTTDLGSKVLTHSSIAGFELTENVYPANYQTPRHSHDYTYFCFILDGAYTLEYRGRGHLCQPAKLLFFPPGATHACHVHTDSRCFNVQVDSKLLEYLDVQNHMPADHVVQKRDELIQLALRLYKEMYTVDQFSALTVEGLTHEIAAEFLRHSEKFSGKKAPPWLLTARDYICEEFVNELTLSSIASLAGVHPTHLAREFHRNFQTTIGDFVRRRRIELACATLRRSRVPLSEIASEAGFYDQSHFTRVFKKATGMTPGAYRQAFGSC